jgi:RNA polymerase sigma-70 factor (ECF subfamily)
MQSMSNDPPFASRAENAEQLLGIARGGDADALGTLLELYRGYLKQLARKQLRDDLPGKVDASDLVQETYLRAQRTFADFRGQTEADLLAWLRQILVRNVAACVRRYRLAQLRDLRRERSLGSVTDDSSRASPDWLADSGDSPSHQAAQNEEGVLLASALDHLPELYREILVMRHLEGLTFPEISTRTGRSCGSIQKIWVRALKRLHRMLRGLQ